MEKIAPAERQSVVSEPFLAMEKGFKILSHEIYYRFAQN
jgi:hypothetical protein